MLRVSEDQAAVILKTKCKKKRVNKYGAKKTVVNGTRFDSKREGKRYNDLVRRQMAREIHTLTLQPTFPIDIGGIIVCKVKLDFKYFDYARKKWVFEDSKGRDNAMSKLKRKMVEAQYLIKVELV